MHVLRASTGQAVDPFPFRVFGKVMSPPLLTKLDDPKELGLQIVLTAFDGFLYIIDGPTGGWVGAGVWLGGGCLGRGGVGGSMGQEGKGQGGAACVLQCSAF